MRFLRWAFPAVTILAASACSTYFNPGRCDRTSDCQSMAGYAGYVCDLDPNIQGDGRCVPPCSTSAECTGGRVCNFDSQNVGRCLLPADGGPAGAAGTGGQAAGGTGGAGTTGAGGGGGGGVAGASAGGSTDGGGPDVNPCNACGGNTPVCLQAMCVECATSADCTGSTTKPICDLTSHTCVACTSDSQCVAKLGATGNPGVCRSELDGHCATDAETIYVQNSAGCVANGGSSSGGTAAAPYCSMEPVAVAAGSTKTLVVVRGTVAGSSTGWSWQRGQSQPATLFVGQQTAVIASATNPGFSMESGTVYIRSVGFNASASICVEATGGTLNLESVTVDSCKGGGIYLDGAAFDIENSTVTNNGPGTSGAMTWGGILVNALPSTGPSILKLDTVEMNKQVGVSCAKAITGTGVLAAQNTGNVDISGTCGFQSCSPMSSTCGAQ